MTMNKFQILSKFMQHVVVHVPLN